MLENLCIGHIAERRFTIGHQEELSMTGSTARTQRQKGEAFRALHARPQTFIIPNPWDPGTARLLAAAGFEALATTSAGYAFSVGRRDGTVTRDEMMEHVGRIVTATDLPVSADLESGFGDDPRLVAATIRLGAERGLVGASIEDLVYAQLHGRAARLHDRDFAAERVRAAVEEARKLPFPFTLTARCENFLIGNPDLDDTIARLHAYQDAGDDDPSPARGDRPLRRSPGQLRRRSRRCAADAAGARRDRRPPREPRQHARARRPRDVPACGRRDEGARELHLRRERDRLLGHQRDARRVAGRGQNGVAAQASVLRPLLTAVALAGVDVLKDRRRARSAR